MDRKACDQYLRKEYVLAGKKEKGRLLDEAGKRTGLARKVVTRKLNHPEGLVRRARKKRRAVYDGAVRKRLKRPAPEGLPLRAANEEWALDFVSDAVAGGGRIRILTELDGYTRQCPGTEVGTSIGSRRVTRALERMIARWGAPKRLRCDNGPEFTSRHFLAWCERQGIEVVHIQPGRPMQNGYLERFNGRLRDECLNANWFANLAEAKEKIEAWRKEDNTARPRQQSGVSHAGGVCAAVLRTHQQDGRTGRMKPGFPNCDC
jgi:transposase InsO family protein